MKRTIYMSLSLCCILLLSGCITSTRDDVFYIRGEVMKPGCYEYHQDMRLRDAVSMAGGLTSFSSDKVTIKRQGNELTYFIVPIDEKMDIGFSRKRYDSVNLEYPTLEPDDIVRIFQGCLSQEAINWTRKKSN